MVEIKHCQHFNTATTKEKTHTGIKASHTRQLPQRVQNKACQTTQHFVDSQYIFVKKTINKHERSIGILQHLLSVE